MMNTMQKNEMYKSLNERFDKRSAFLRNKGYKYTRIEEFNIAIFVKKDNVGRHVHSIQTGTVTNANEEVWQDIENEIMNRCK